MTIKEKYHLFLSIVREFADIDREAGEVKIPQSEFIQRGLTLDDLRKFFEQAERKREGYLMKTHILFAPIGTTPSLTTEFKEKPIGKHKLPWYVIDPDREKLKRIHSTAPSGATRTGKLYFSPADGIADYRTAQWTCREGTKPRALLTFLTGNKNTPFSLEDIQRFCNKNIRLEKHRFRGEKDVDDTIRGICNKLKVRKGEYFPIHKVENSKWIWVER